MIYDMYGLPDGVDIERSWTTLSVYTLQAELFGTGLFD